MRDRCRSTVPAPWAMGPRHRLGRGHCPILPIPLFRSSAVTASTCGSIIPRGMSQISRVVQRLGIGGNTTFLSRRTRPFFWTPCGGAAAPIQPTFLRTLTDNGPGLRPRCSTFAMARHDKGVNVLFFDGSVRYIARQKPVGPLLAQPIRHRLGRQEHHFP